MAIAVYEEFHVSRFFTIMEIRHSRAGPAGRGGGPGCQEVTKPQWAGARHPPSTQPSSSSCEPTALMIRNGDSHCDLALCTSKENLV